MLSIQKKLHILRQARLAPPHEPPTDEGGLARWRQDIEQRFVAFRAARTAHSLRRADEARRNALLQRMSWSGSGS